MTSGYFSLKRVFAIFWAVRSWELARLIFRPVSGSRTSPEYRRAVPVGANEGAAENQESKSASSDAVTGRYVLTAISLGANLAIAVLLLPTNSGQQNRETRPPKEALQL